MVQSNYTVSSVQQLLGKMPPVRVSGSRSKSTASATSADTSGKHVRAADTTNITPAPTRPLPATPLRTVRVRASASSDVLAVTDNIKIRTDIPEVVDEGEVLTLSAKVYTPTTINANDHKNATLETRTSNSVAKPSTSMFVPLLEAPQKGKKPPGLEKRISQYYEYITPPVSLDLGRSGSRRERKASHTPTSSGGSDIYFSPIDATRSEAFLSSPQPSPPIVLSLDVLERHLEESVKLGSVVEKVATLVISTAPVAQPEVIEIAEVEKDVEGERRVTLTLTHLDRISTALALAPLVQMRVRGTHLDMLPEDMTTTAFDKAAKAYNNLSTTKPTDLPTPPPSESEASSTEEFGGVALINTRIEGAPITLASTDAFAPGKCTHLSLPYGLSTASTLRVESFRGAESKIILQSLFAALDRKTGAHNLILLAETDVTTSFARAALTELAHTQNVTIDELEIRTPTAATASSPDGSIDWCAIGQEDDSDILATSPVTNILDETIAEFNSTLSAETCMMQTLTLLSELSRLQKAHATFLVLQPTKYDSQGALAAVKIPLVSHALRQRFAQMEGASSSAGGSGQGSSTGSSAHGGLKGKVFREAVILAVAPRFQHGEEFETFVVLEGGRVRVRARCVPLAGVEDVERWVCFLGGEYDVPY